MNQNAYSTTSIKLLLKAEPMFEPMIVNIVAALLSKNLQVNKLMCWNTYSTCFHQLQAVGSHYQAFWAEREFYWSTNYIFLTMHINEKRENILALPFYYLIISMVIYGFKEVNSACVSFQCGKPLDWHQYSDA
jgi:hypothetical protein